MAPDRQSADAAATTAVTNMHDAVVHETHHLDVAPKQDTPTSGIATAKPEITRRDVHTASSITAQRRFPKANAQDPNLAHQAALRRSALKGKDSARQSLAEPSSTASSKPVLVCAPATKVDMKRGTKTKVRTEAPDLPPLESFSIQDILASIGPEADASIDAIAEICGRSKMSLAEEHGSHRPPQAQLDTPNSSPAGSLPSIRLEPVVEAASAGPQTRSKARNLRLANAFRDGEPVSSDAMAATSNVTSQGQAKVSRQTREDNVTDSATAPLLSQVFAWLRRSTASSETAGSSNRDITVENTLRSMLGDTDSLRS